MNTLRPFANPLLQASEFDSDASKPMMMCTVPSAGEPVRFAMPAKYVELLQEFDGERTEEEAVDAFLRRNPDTFERSWLLRLVQQSLMPKGLILYPHQDPTCAGVSGQSRRSFLFIQLPIIPPSVVDAVATRLSFMFEAPAMLVGAALFVLSHALVYALLLRQHHVDFNALDAGSILLLMLLSTLGTICHEFGHASAAAHFGCRRMTIGWGVYVIYTVLWTNVSEAWKLPRWQRAIVDIGGVYFESLFLLVMLGLYLHTGKEVFLFAFVFIDFSIVTTFNPFLRMDGYWLVSDMLGIVNLRQQQSAWVQDLLSNLSNSSGTQRRSDLTRRAKWVLGIYSVLGIAFLAYLLHVLVTVVLLQVAIGMPALVATYVHDVTAGKPLIHLLGGSLEIIWRILMLLGAATMLLSLLRRGAAMVAIIGDARTSARANAA